MKVGDQITITCEGRTVDGEVTEASGNGRALIVSFEAILDGHVGHMPVLLHHDGKWRSIVNDVEVELARRPEIS